MNKVAVGFGVFFMMISLLLLVLFLAYLGAYLAIKKVATSSSVDITRLKIATIVSGVILLVFVTIGIVLLVVGTEKKKTVS